MFSVLMFVTGLALLVAGANWLINGAAQLANRWGVSPLVIGLTVVAFGTSAPEFAVSIEAAIAGQDSVGLGNVVGSNIFNVLFILGLTALIVPLVVGHQLIRRDVPVMIGASLLVWWLARDGRFSHADGALLFAGLLGYLGYVFYQSSRQDENLALPLELQAHAPAWRSAVSVLFGLAMLVLGSRWLLEAVVAFATYLGVSDLVIGLTLVAAGTSLPEVVASIAAAIKGQRDMAVGNVVGSNIFNLLGVLGLSSLLAPVGLTAPASLVAVDVPVMCLVALMCLPIFFTGARVDRFEGCLFLLGYVAYTTYLVFAALAHPLVWMGDAVFLFLLPVGLLIIAQVVQQLQDPD
ncbi:calcium/sodium antiporter [Simiduia sp. 21SJ11W-1]|uniref:calcium/sodium antiporter n=1 Tax=Simiduia sp. 21SJ11W-1 TaxID=2909669 RepID=UPI0020A1C4FC|nr:calcium/sodium antiporter [Simiduia sp. 21SJ11W-1]UTA47802.1 calcium/sodium antiporter [Simiduia sp. 21SJ11W-1]